MPRLVPLHPTQQSLPPRPHQTQHQRRRMPPLSPQNRRSPDRVLQRARRRVDTRQLRYHLRITGRDDGLWLPTDDGDKDITRVSSHVCYKTSKSGVKRCIDTSPDT